MAALTLCMLGSHDGVHQGQGFTQVVGALRAFETLDKDVAHRGCEVISQLTSDDESQFDANAAKYIVAMMAAFGTKPKAW